MRLTRRMRRRPTLSSLWRRKLPRGRARDGGSLVVLPRLLLMLLLLRRLVLRRGVRWLRRLSRVIMLRLPRVKAFPRNARRGARAMERRIGARRLPWCRQIVSSVAVLAIRLGETLFKHPVIVAHDCCQLGMEIE